MKLIDTVRDKMRSFLRIVPPQSSQIVIQQRMDYYSNAAKNRIWYRGDSQELSEMYRQLDVSPAMFWRAASTRGMEIRKIHTGLPKLTVDTLVNIVMNDYNGAAVTDSSDSSLQELWDNTAAENKIDKLLKKCLENMLIIGDGAFKISIDTSISEYPIIEFYPGEYVEYVRTRGRITEIVFMTEYMYNRKEYVLKEAYSRGSIRCRLFNESGTEVPLHTIPQTLNLAEGWTFAENVMLAVPCVYGISPQYEGRGSGIFDNKTDSFDALDEAWSQWMDALRAGRSKQYIPESLIPRDSSTGALLKPNAFDNRFIAIGDDMSENQNNRIISEQPAIPTDSYLSTYITALDLCLQGIISPSTLGIDVKKLDNAEAQREKEKTTLYTRGNLIEFMREIVPELIQASIAAYRILTGQPAVSPAIDINFGEYANPSFEAIVETVSKARQGGIMSLEACIDELYGDSKDDKWKSSEVERLKAEQGVSASAADDSEVF